MRAGAALRFVLRESRGSGGRLAFLAGCLAVGVAAVVGTAATIDAVEEGARARSREILGADLSVEAHRPLPASLDDLLARLPDAERTDVRETPTMVGLPGDGDAPGRSRLALLRAVEGRYPLYGEVVTEPPGGLAAHLDAGSAVAARELLDALGARRGDQLLVGGARFRVAAAILDEPGRLGFADLVGPRLYVSGAGYERTSLGGFGARTLHAALLALPGSPGERELRELGRRIETEIEGGAYLDVDTHYDGRGGPRGLRRLESFVGLVALLSLLLGGIGVSQVVRAWLDGRAQVVAVLRCTGLRPGEILGLFLGHAVLVGLAGSLAGAAIGAALPFAVHALAPDVVPRAGLSLLPLEPVLRGIALGTGLAAVFALPPLTAVWRVPPARVLRADAEPLPASRAASAAVALVLVAGVLGAAWIQAGDLERAAWFAGGLAVLALLLRAAARGLTAIAARVPPARLERHVRHGVRALTRPGAGVAGAVTALGLGVMVVTAIWIVERRLADALLAAVPEGAPSVFLVDVQPSQWPGVRASLEEAGAEHVVNVPVVTARIRAIDGRPVEELAREEARSRRRLTREQRLTWLDTLPEDNRITAGALWSEPSLPEISVEERFARQLGVGLGSRITFDVQGVPVDVHVTSLRSVEWQSLAINFFLVVEPGVLEGAPASLLANAVVPAGAEQALQDRLARDFPNVTMLRVRGVLERIRGLAERLAVGVRLLGSFTVVAGFVILAGAISAGALRRSREAALLKVLGATRSDVAALLSAEYASWGAVAGAVGSAGALLLAWSFLELVLQIEVDLPTRALPVATLAAALLTALCGVAASTRALRAPPADALR